MSERLIVINAEDLTNLLTVYTDGDVPLDAKLKEIAINKFFDRTILFEMESSQWKETSMDLNTGKIRPLIVRYDGKKTLSWHQKKDEPYQWREFSKE
jgi:hypothetical protein